MNLIWMSGAIVILLSRRYKKPQWVAWVFGLLGLEILYSAIQQTYDERWGYAIFNFVMAILYGFVVLKEYIDWIKTRSKTDA